MPLPDCAPVMLVRADDAEVLTDGPTSLITLLADADATGGALTANRATLHPGSPGAPPHYHAHMAEAFYILDGAMHLLAGEQILTLHKGDFVVVPTLMPHAFAPAAGQRADLLVIFTPGQPRFDYYRLLHRVHHGDAHPRDIAASGEQFDNHYVDSAAWTRQRAAEK